LQGGAPVRSRFDAINDADSLLVPFASIRLHAPVPRPGKFLAIGMNYKAHCLEAQELGIAIPKYQLWFNKQTSCITGPYDMVELPRVSEQLDYEAELAVVIGTRCRHVTVESARKVIAGYMIANDVSVRDWQMRSPTHTLGKSFDTHGPTGPWLTFDNEIADPHALRIRTLVNGEVRQDSTTQDMLYDIYEQIAYLTIVMTLEPGDILSTGTPSGVGAGRRPPAWLRAGDLVRVEIEELGAIENRIVPEPV
jgi:2-keto-4-pentenoate hydratase/2-oxohepta-3-ene-1,7-dioic acid hydratase in catechol pathway